MKQNNQKWTISLTDIFKKWEVDIVRPLSIIRKENKYIVITMNYFLKWLEVRSLKVANANTVVKFLYKEIICRFKASRTLQSDREIYFINEVIQRLINWFRIQYNLLLLYHL